MSTATDLLQRIQAALQGATAAGLNIASKTWDLYEAYLFGLVLNAARAEGATVTYENVTGALVANLVFPTSPRFLKTSTAGYTHAVLTFGSPVPDLEVHTGVYVAGSSGCVHELDVLVVRRDAAAAVRSAAVAKGTPRAKDLVLLLEAKFYELTKLGISETRDFWGLQADFESVARFFVLSKDADPPSRFLARRKVLPELQAPVVPSDAAGEARLTGLLQQAFNEHKRRA